MPSFNVELALKGQQENSSYVLHVGLRSHTSGVVTLPRYHSTEVYLKWKTDYCPELDLKYLYVSSIYVSSQHRRQGLATRLLHILCTANDKSPQQYEIGLVASPAAGSGIDIEELDEWYEKRGFVYNPEVQMHFRQCGDKQIYKIRNKYEATRSQRACW